MAGFKILLYASMAALATAEINSHVVHLSSLPKALNVSSLAKTFSGPPVDALKAKISHPSKSRSLIDRQTLVVEECLDPLDRPISSDCEAVCENVHGQQGPLLIPPLDVWYIEQGHCVFGVANLDPCENIDVDPISVLYSFCQSMYLNCAVDGYDGYLQYKDPAVAMALSGTPAAPPYSEQPCGS